MGNESREPMKECTFCEGRTDLLPLGRKWVCGNCRGQLRKMDEKAAAAPAPVQTPAPVLPEQPRPQADVAQPQVTTAPSAEKAQEPQKPKRGRPRKKPT